MLSAIFAQNNAPAIDCVLLAVPVTMKTALNLKHIQRGMEKLDASRRCCRKFGRAGNRLGA